MESKMLKNHTTTAAILSLGLALSLSISPAFAEKNRGDFNKSVEGNRILLASDCSFYGKEFKKAEKEADKRGGTPAAKKYADAADTLWEYGSSLGCSWAK
jgi:hypothetical protein